jgi:hypothetical protein
LALYAAASDLKHTNKIKELFAEELKDPKEELVRYFMQGASAGRATQSALDRFKVIVKKALNQHISDLMNERFKAAMEGPGAIVDKSKTTIEEPLQHEEDKKDIEPTELEMEAFYTIKTLLRDTVEASRVVYKAQAKFFNVLLDSNQRKCICRLYLREDKKYISFPHDQSNKIVINKINDVYDRKEDFVKAIDYCQNKKIAVRDAAKDVVAETTIETNTRVTLDDVKPVN